MSASALRLRRAALLQRQLALAAVTLLAAVTAFAIADKRGSSLQSGLPRQIPAQGGGWYSAFAAPTGRRAGRRTACGHVVTARSVGVASTTLPCDIKLFVRYRDRTVLTQVIDRGPYVPGRAFELTRELAQLLGLSGTHPIRWRYAG